MRAFEVLARLEICVLTRMGVCLYIHVCVMFVWPRFALQCVTSMPAQCGCLLCFYASG